MVAAHADDESLGCGGTIALHSQRGDTVNVLFMTNGVSSREHATTEMVKSRINAMDKAMDCLGVSNYQAKDFPDNELDSIALLDIVKEVEDFNRKHGDFDRIYTHHAGDLNIDHQITHRAVMTCFRPQPDANHPNKILTFEVLSSTGWYGTSAPYFQPNHYIDIKETLQNKLAALKAYQEEMRPWPHARSILAVTHLAGLRGTMVGLEAAEAFFTERSIENL